jgi:hypothetical protein
MTLNSRNSSLPTLWRQAMGIHSLVLESHVLEVDPLHRHPNEMKPSRPLRVGSQLLQFSSLTKRDQHGQERHP